VTRSVSEPQQKRTITRRRRVFRWLDKAALQLEGDLSGEEEPNPWRLCTVTQVEEVKILLRLLPVPACTVMLSVVLTEFLTLSVQQAYTLNTTLSALHLPVTCMPVFPCLAIFLILALYYNTFTPLARRVTGHPHGASQLQRVGLGLFFCVLSVAWAGVFERYRRGYAIRHGYLGLFLTAMPDLSAYWLLIQYCLIGVAEVFSLVALLEFLYQEAPDAMRSVGSAYAAVAGGLGCFFASALNSAVDVVTGNAAEGRPSWLAQNINVGRFDYLYWLLAVLSTINLLVFVYFAKRYKYRVRLDALDTTTSRQQP
jgi:solute carrier family 15 (peptide/histidine transporter), member 3/4